MAETDILLGEDGDLQIGAAGLVVGVDLMQRQRTILFARKGDIKHNPEVGVGMEDYLLEDEVAGIRGKITEEYEADGLEVLEIKMSSLIDMIIDADYAS